MLRAVPSLLLAVACASPVTGREPTRTSVQVGPAPTGGDAPPGAGPDLLVWTTDAEDRVVTHRTRPGATTQRLADGVLIAAGSDVWRLELETTAVTLYECDWQGDDGPRGKTVGTKPALRATLERLGRGTKVEVSAAPLDEVADIDHRIAAVASVGPYLFLVEHVWTYSCGAHGHVEVRSMAFDVRAQAALEPLTDADGDAVSRSARGEALRMFAADDQAGFGELRAEDVVLTRLLPRWTGEGLLEVGARFTAPACYACSDGLWSSYTRSADVALGFVPERLAPYARAPFSVASFEEAHPGERVAGWSAVESPAALDALDAWQRDLAGPTAIGTTRTP